MGTRRKNDARVAQHRRRQPHPKDCALPARCDSCDVIDLGQINDDPDAMDAPVGAPHAYARPLWPLGSLLPRHWFSNAHAYPLYPRDAVQSYLHDRHVDLGYRSGYSRQQAAKSVACFHNETGSIWTHLIGFVGFVAFGLATLAGWTTPSEAGWPARVGLACYAAGVAGCFLFSTLFHTFGCVNRGSFVHYGCLDYAGISLLMSTATLVALHYTHYCAPVWTVHVPFSALTVLLSLPGVLGPTLIPPWPTASWHMYRTLVYVAAGAVSAAPLLHHAWSMWGVDAALGSQLWWVARGFMVVAILNSTGALVYVAKVPERFAPGRLDYGVTSHQLWHAVIVVSAAVHAYTCIQLIEWRILGQGRLECPIM
ncbi:hemolysin-III related-domain-containing protein [Blastocladiella britannica]|nr:hemolysin-III related-domain-containing protein [Blastocladiella britannica]